LAEAVSSPTYCRPLLGLQAQPFESQTGCAQAHPSLLEIKKSPRGFLTVSGNGVRYLSFNYNILKAILIFIHH